MVCYAFSFLPRKIYEYARTHLYIMASSLCYIRAQQVFFLFFRGGVIIIHYCLYIIPRWLGVHGEVHARAKAHEMRSIVLNNIIYVVRLPYTYYNNNNMNSVMYENNVLINLKIPEKKILL